MEGQFALEHRVKLNKEIEDFLYSQKSEIDKNKLFAFLAIREIETSEYIGILTMVPTNRSYKYKPVYDETTVCIIPKNHRIELIVVLKDYENDDSLINLASEVIQESKGMYFSREIIVIGKADNMKLNNAMKNNGFIELGILVDENNEYKTPQRLYIKEF